MSLWTRPSSLASSSTLQGSPALYISPSDDTVESTNLYPRIEEGERILKSHDFSTILLLLRFWPYSDESLLHSVLRNRRISILATLLVLAEIDNRQAINGLSKDQMLDRLKPLYHINSPTWHPIFGPRQTVNQTPEGLATIVNQQSWRGFLLILFEDWVQYTLGHSVTSVEDFLYYHTHVLRTMVSSYLYMYPHQLQKYRLATHVSLNFQILSPPADFTNRHYAGRVPLRI